MITKDMQDIRIRAVPVKLVRRFKAAIAAEGWNLAEWFVIAAAKTAEAYETKMKTFGYENECRKGARK